MEYDNIVIATFISRPNRFIAHCLLEGQEVIAHVKNTGRGQEVFLKGAQVGLVYSDNPKRKTKYDLVSIEKNGAWFNIDSQVTNTLVNEGLKTGFIQLPDLGPLKVIKREQFFQDSKYDFYLEDTLGKKAFLEVKGMTLENKGVGAFPDAPTLRGLKHVLEMEKARKLGFETYVFFVAQSETIKKATLHKKMQPELPAAFTKGLQEGLHVLSYNCKVTPGSITLAKEIPFSLGFPFQNPIKK